MTIRFSICNVIFLCHPAVPVEWIGLFLPPGNVTITSIMACQLFRKLQLGQLIGSHSDWIPLRIGKYLFQWPYCQQLEALQTQWISCFSCVQLQCASFSQARWWSCGRQELKNICNHGLSLFDLCNRIFSVLAEIFAVYGVSLHDNNQAPWPSSNSIVW